jgi:hypothetical protein
MGRVDITIELKPPGNDYRIDGITGRAAINQNDFYTILTMEKSELTRTALIAPILGVGKNMRLPGRVQVPLEWCWRINFSPIGGGLDRPFNRDFAVCCHTILHKVHF